MHVIALWVSFAFAAVAVWCGLILCVPPVVQWWRQQRRKAVKGHVAGQGVIGKES
jgi:hypothetical protein